MNIRIAFSTILCGSAIVHAINTNICNNVKSNNSFLISISTTFSSDTTPLENHIAHLQNRIADDEEISIKHHWVFNSHFNGYCVKFKSPKVCRLLLDHLSGFDHKNVSVGIAEEDHMAELSSVNIQSSFDNWGLDRIDQQFLPMDGLFHYNSRAGEGVDIYIVDTGIKIDHEEFGGRARWGVTTRSESLALEDDDNGHG